MSDYKKEIISLSYQLDSRMSYIQREFDAMDFRINKLIREFSETERLITELRNTIEYIEEKDNE